mgnify:FL=1
MKLYQMTCPENGITYGLTYIDIEQKIDGHLFMFGLDRGDGYERFVVDCNLHAAAERYEAIPITEAEILKEIFRGDDALMIVGYTETELNWVCELVRKYCFKVPMPVKYLDAKLGIQKWASMDKRGVLRNMPPLLVTKKKRNRPGLRSLISVARLIDIPVPSDYGYGITSERFTHASRMLETRGSFGKLTKVVKGKLTKAMKHNQFDVETMVKLVGVVYRERPSILDGAVKPAVFPS